MAEKTKKHRYLPYHGSKYRILDEILEIIEGAEGVGLYCEPFTGGGTVIHNLKNYEVMVINDIDEGLINFYRQARHPYGGR